MARPDEALRNPDLLAALPLAIAGRTEKLEALLLRVGIMPSGKPNLNLASAVGAALAAAPGPVAKLLTRFGNEDGPADSPRTVFPVVAAHGWAACIRVNREVEAGWAALSELSTDERAPVRVGVLDAVQALSLREGGADALLERATSWLDAEDREERFAAAALAIEVLGDPRLISALSNPEALLSYLSAAMREIADAPRAAERSDGRRRALTSLSLTLGTVVITLRAGERGLTWFEAECTNTKHPDVRLALSQAIQRLRSAGQAPASHITDALRASLEQSAKPLREAARVRPGTGRGRSSRRTR
jgi:hypothetical protein